MLIPLENQDLPKQKTSHLKIMFKCSCGNICSVVWKDYLKNRTKTCGKCMVFKFKNSGIKKFNKLTLIENIDNINVLTQHVLFKCDCNKEKMIRLQAVINGGIKSCGCSRSEFSKNFKNYLRKTKFEWMEEIPDILNNNLPESWSAGSGFICSFKCSCGNTFKKKFCHFKNGKSTCSKCNLTHIKTGDIINTFKYEGLPIVIKTSSREKGLFRCKCGNTKLISFNGIFHRKQKTCTECFNRSIEWWKENKFGKCRIKNPEEASKLSIYSNKKLEFICDCGTEFKRSIQNVVKTGVSCGNCRHVSIDWYVKNSKKLKSLIFPLKRENFPLGGPEPLEDILNKSKKSKFRCWLCKNEYFVFTADIIRGYSLSCGCATGQISKANIDISNFISSLNVKSENEYDLNGLKYDIGVESEKLLIEHHGIKWHSSLASKKRDLIKYDNALKFGWDLIVIFEDEWNQKKDIFEKIIQNKLKLNDFKKIRCQKCQIRKINSKEANEFYEKHHYIGKCYALYHYGVFYFDRFVCCMSFGRPTRQSAKQEFEISRMASVSDIHVFAIWSKILKLFIIDHNPKSIVTYSDNRLFSGKVYENLGFSFDGYVKPDYYWSLNNKRYHKSSLRKEKNSSLTESQLRESQGYRKIWDLGKKRWVKDLM